MHLSHMSTDSCIEPSVLPAALTPRCSIRPSSLGEKGGSAFVVFNTKRNNRGLYELITNPLGGCWVEEKEKGLRLRASFAADFTELKRAV